MRKMFVVVVLFVVVFSCASLAHADSHTARIVANVSIIGQTGDVTVASITVPTGGASYRISTYVTRAAGMVLLAWTDNIFATSAIASLDTPLIENSTAFFHAAGGTTLTVSTSGTSGTYNIVVVIEEF